MTNIVINIVFKLILNQARMRKNKSLYDCHLIKFDSISGEISCTSKMDVYKTWAKVHGPPHGPDPWTWTTPNFQKEIAPVNMKIYRSPGNEKHRLVFIHQYTLITNLCS